MVFLAVFLASMKNDWPVKKLEEITVGVIIIAFAIILLMKGQYFWCILTNSRSDSLPQTQFADRDCG